MEGIGCQKEGWRGALQATKFVVYVVVARPALLLGASNCVVSLYIYHLVCAASAECRASSDVAICRQSVSQESMV